MVKGSQNGPISKIITFYCYLYGVYFAIEFLKKISVFQQICCSFYRFINMRVPKGTDAQIVVCVYFKSNVNGLKVYYYTSDIRVPVLVKTSHVRKTKLALGNKCHVSCCRVPP